MASLILVCMVLLAMAGFVNGQASSEFVREGQMAKVQPQDTMWRRVCQGDKQGWVRDDGITNAGYLYCDVSQNPCGLCPYTVGKLPGTLTFSPTSVGGPTRDDPSSHCGEKTLPGGLKYTPKNCGGDHQGCLSISGITVACTDSVVTIPYPAVALAPQHDYTDDIRVSLLTVCIVIILSNLSLVAIALWMWKFWFQIRFSGYLIDVGVGRRYDITALCKRRTSAHVDGSWYNGRFEGVLTVAGDDDVEGEMQTRIFITPPVGFSSDYEYRESFQVLRYKFWGLYMIRLPRVYNSLDVYHG